MSATTTVVATTGAIASSTQTCTNPKPGKNGYLPPEACDAILLYVPSLAAAVLFCILYGLTLICHGVQAFLYKKRYAWVIIMGATWELIAFIFRALLTQNQNNSNYDTIYTIMFLLAPLWINAFLYMTLGRLIHFFLPTQTLAGITSQKYGRIFVWLDIFAFIVQLAGAAITTPTDIPTRTIMIGVHIYMGGIGLQEFFILIFTCLTIHLHRSVLHLEKTGTLPGEKTSGANIPWRWMFYALYTALGLITVRIIFRLAQYAQGTSPTNPVLTHESYEYIFDAVPMFLALGLLNVIHPGRVLQGPDSEFPRLSRREKKMVKEEKKRVKREEREAKKTRKGGSGGWWGRKDRTQRGSDMFEILPMEEEGVVGR
ncbi:RTA1 domain protein [Aspergillus sclerotioniger CBS 115572]|uniref:RTA1 domain protein n=1 Tax=Aspergillus sclerotioniger CBS 115572 TaxID=1450535 RepID=A0A317WTL1_9EURO|nr:RTA1 domain protein [Aspergillus sclerotioniger CBS 115572]PWY89669.1 RTA1 domain protein [Aspergillus sclerotioniger CBS 115572]